MTLATPANTFTSHWREGPGRVLWAPRGQRRCSKSYDTQDGPTTENGLVPNGSRAPGKCATAGGSPIHDFSSLPGPVTRALQCRGAGRMLRLSNAGRDYRWDTRADQARPTQGLGRCPQPSISSPPPPPSVLPSPLPSCSQQPLSTCGLRGAERRLAACTGAGEPLRRCVMIRELAPRSDRGAWTIPEPTAPARARRTLSGRAR